MMSRFRLRMRMAMATVCLLVAGGAGAEEIWLHDNTRVYGLIDRIADDPGAPGLLVRLPDGSQRRLAFDEIIAIRFLGRDPLLLPSGTRELRFVNGGQLRGQVVANEGDRLVVDSAAAGPLKVDLARLRGFVSLPLVGFTGRKAEELVDSPPDARRGANLDELLDQRGSVYPGVIRRLDKTEVQLYHEELVRIVPVKMSYVAGVRLADRGRDQPAPWAGDVQMRFSTRDGTVVRGKLVGIELGRWLVKPAWDEQATLALDLEEIAQVVVCGGRVQYLSQLTPVAVKEQTVLAPPQPHRMDRSATGEAISIAGKRYPWGIGVHADSELTFDLGGKFKRFRSDVGIATRMGRRGSVVFTVLGDGKELYASPVVTGADAAPREVDVSVDGVQKLTLKVADGGDLDLGDVANWGSARVLKEMGTGSETGTGSSHRDMPVPISAKDKATKTQPR